MGCRDFETAANQSNSRASTKPLVARLTAPRVRTAGASRRIVWRRALHSHSALGANKSVIARTVPSALAVKRLQGLRLRLDLADPALDNHQRMSPDQPRSPIDAVQAQLRETLDAHLQSLS